MTRIVAPAMYPLAARLVALVEERLDHSRRHTQTQAIATVRAAVQVAAVVAREMECAGMLIMANSQRRLKLGGGLCLSCQDRGVAAKSIGLTVRVGSAQDSRGGEDDYR